VIYGTWRNFEAGGTSATIFIGPSTTGRAFVSLGWNRLVMLACKHGAAPSGPRSDVWRSRTILQASSARRSLRRVSLYFGSSIA
jgi:hypothetical protein